MKYLLIIGDGMADYPLPELENRTPLEVAPTPNLDRLASESGRLGMVRTIPRGTMAASDTAFLSIMGLDPRQNHPGRGPLEAINLGLRLTDEEVAFRLNLVTQDEKKMVDSSAGHISDGEAGRLMAVLQEHFQGRRMRFVPGKSYRNLLIMERPPFDWRKLVTTPPHDILGRPLTPYLPKGPGGEFLIGMMEEAARIFAEHPINRTRIDLGENPANLVWPWGQGGPAQLPAFQPRYGLTGFTVSAVDIVKGIGLAVGLEAVSVPGATGYLD